MNFNPNTAFTFANAMELAVNLVLLMLLVDYIFGRIESFRDFWGRVWKMLRHDFQGGPYDVAIAICVIFVGKSLRAHAAWEWRVLDYPLSVTQLFLGVLVTAIGSLCLVRILAPRDKFNLYWVLTAAVAVTFATGSIMLGGGP